MRPQQVGFFDAADMHLERGNEQDKPGEGNEIRSHQQQPEAKRHHGRVDGVTHPFKRAGAHQSGVLLLVHPDPPRIAHRKLGETVAAIPAVAGIMPAT
ncbi:hypothetical protein NCGM2209_2748 [Mycobacterium tuberculosis NCGM2209]|nr:hypothetical protein NCGM2209_2748 [Mycobacterium tuberculosis NCGM2209]